MNIKIAASALLLIAPLAGCASKPSVSEVCRPANASGVFVHLSNGRYAYVEDGTDDLQPYSKHDALTICPSHWKTVASEDLTFCVKYHADNVQYCTLNRKRVGDDVALGA